MKTLAASFLLIILFSIPLALASDLPIIKSGVGVFVSVGGASKSGTCGNNLTSCGTYPSCKNLLSLPTCVNGNIVDNYCNNNQPNVSVTADSCAGNGSSIGVTTGSTNYVLKLNLTDDDGRVRKLSLHFTDSNNDNEITTKALEGISSLSLGRKVVDMDFNYTNLSVKVKDLDLSKVPTNTYNGIVLDQEHPIIPGVTTGPSYHVELPSSFTFSIITIQFNYTGTSLNEDQLLIYKCSTFNFDTAKCKGNWIIITPNIDKVNKIASIDVNSFSVYSLGQSNSTTTTTTTSQTTTTTTTSQTPTTTTTYTTTTQTPTSESSSGGSSGGSSSSNPTTTTTPSTSTTATPTSTTATNTTTNITNTNSTNVSVQTKIDLASFGPYLPYALGIPTSIASFYLFKNKMNGFGNPYRIRSSKEGRRISQRMKKKNKTELKLVLS